MRGIASVADCRELYRVSGWGDTPWTWYCDEAHDDEPGLNLSEPLRVVGGVGYFDTRYPAYDLGYLAGMLPTFKLMKHPNDTYEASWRRHMSDGVYLVAESRTNAANALCRLAVKMFDAGILIREGSQTP